PLDPAKAQRIAAVSDCRPFLRGKGHQRMLVVAHDGCGFRAERLLPLGDQPIALHDLHGLRKCESAEWQRAKPTPRRFVRAQPLVVDIWRSADPLLERIGQRIELRAAWGAVPRRKIDIVLSPKTDWKLAAFDLDRDENAQIMREVNLFSDPTRLNRHGTPQNNDCLGCPHLLIDLQSEIAPFD